jgi:hypothetical protein
VDKSQVKRKGYTSLSPGIAEKFRGTMQTSLRIAMKDNGCVCDLSLDGLAGLTNNIPHFLRDRLRKEHKELYHYLALRGT